MRKLIKKITMYLLIASLGWFPIQVTFASSFIMPAKVMLQADPQSSTTAQSNQDKKGCDMHKFVKDCCSSNSACNPGDQECGHCLSFIAMTHDQQQINFPPRYVIQNEYAYCLTGMTNIPAYRPPQPI
ncbi:hypothetical protein JYT31_00930 [Beggiatoa alba]|nr:hypothetical protein [Beggiatoa alba]